MLIVYGCCLQQCNSLIYFHLNPFHLIIYSSGLSMLILAMICFSAKFWCDYSRLYISAWILAMVYFNAKFCFSFTLCPVVSLWRNTAWSYTLFLKDTKKISRNDDSYYGLKSKLEYFSAGIFIVGSHLKVKDHCWYFKVILPAMNKVQCLYCKGAALGPQISFAFVRIWSVSAIFICYNCKYIWFFIFYLLPAKARLDHVLKLSAQVVLLIII
jgi:hypothetical protein